MSKFITYSQNFEDLMLWRALKGVDAGFYIDVGAADPNEDSVTRAFYERGWRGVNIEPGPEYFAALTAARPRDVNLRCLVGATTGETTLHYIANTGLSTTREAIANLHAGNGRPSEPLTLKVRTLADICADFAPADIHFLKIDVEGAEGDVLEGADFATWRPWIVVVEATAPNSPVENWHGWDNLLIQSDYRFAWFDGLNRFYLAAERAEALRHAFRTPPNVFDDWARPAEAQIAALHDAAHAAWEETNSLRQETGRVRAAFDAEISVAREEAQAGRIEASAARTALSTAQQEAAAARTEASVLRVADRTSRQEASLARAQADAARHEAHVALTELNRLSGAAQAQARDHAEARVAALLASTSWRITAPVRAVRSLFDADPGRRRRLRLVAGLGGEQGSVKGSARIAIYGLGRAAARIPGGRGLSKLARSVAPGPVEWLALRYRVYARAAAELSPAPHPVVEAFAAPWNFAPTSTSDDPGPGHPRPDLSDEESHLYRQLATQAHTATPAGQSRRWPTLA